MPPSKTREIRDNRRRTVHAAILTGDGRNGSAGRHPQLVMRAASPARPPIEWTVLDGTSRQALPGADTIGEPAAPYADALERALREVRRSQVGAVGPYAGAVAAWLTQSGREATVLSHPEAGKRERRRRRAAQWHTLVAVHCIEHAPDPEMFLRNLRPLLAPEGRLIAVIRNVMHARVRVSMLMGEYPRAFGRINGMPSHALTVPDLEQLLGAAGFLVTGVERQVDSPDILASLCRGVPESVAEMLAADTEALTSHFVFIAEPLESAAVGTLQRRFRQMLTAQEDAAHGMQRLQQRLDQLEGAAESRQVAGSSRAALHIDPATLVDLPERVQRLGTETGALVSAVERLHRDVGALSARTERDGESLGTVSDVMGRLEARADSMATDVRAAVTGVQAATSREADRERLLREARERLLQRTREARALIAGVERTRYRRVVARVRALVDRVVPRGGKVAVVTRGDHELVVFDQARGWHFPQTEAGVYAGHHPADSAAAIAHLEELRARGAQFLLLPRTAFWWLEHYREFADHLRTRHRCLVTDQTTGALWQLTGGTAS